MRAALCRTFVHACALEHLRENLPDLELDDLLGIVGIKFRVSFHKAFCPVGVLGEFLIFAQIFAVQKRSPEVGHFLFEPSGQDRQTHDLDEADVLLFDVVELCVGVIDAQRMLRRPL